MTTRLFTLAALLILAASTKAHSQPPTFNESTASVLVEVPVEITVGGRPLVDLGEARFELYDRGVRQEIVSIERVDLGFEAGSGPALTIDSNEARFASEPPPYAQRTFYAVFDLAYSPAGKLIAAEEGLRRLIERSAHPTDRFGIALFSALNGWMPVLEPTVDRAALRQALDMVLAVLAQRPQLAAANLASWFEEPPTSAPELVAEARLNALQRADPAWPHTSIVDALTAGFERLSGSSGGLREAAPANGRKHLLYLSAGPPDRYFSLGHPDRPRVMADLERALVALRRNSWTVHSINLGGLGFGGDALVALAHDTGGRLFTNSHNIELLLSEVEQATRVTWILAFQPQGVAADGEYHPLKVKLVDGPKGARLTHRPGYVAVSSPLSGRHGVR